MTLRRCRLIGGKLGEKETNFVAIDSLNWRLRFKTLGLFSFCKMKRRGGFYRKLNDLLFIEFFSNSDLSVPADVRKVYPTFRTQWNGFRKLIRSFVRDMKLNDQFKLNRFKSISRRFYSYRTNGKSKNYEIWNHAIISHYGSDETGFVEIRDFSKNDYFNSPN